MDPHRLAERTSIELHRAVGERLRSRPDDVVERARARVEDWLREGRPHPEYAKRWRALLTEPVDLLCDRLVEDTEEMRALRQVSPFAGELDARTRWSIWRRVREHQRESA